MSPDEQDRHLRAQPQPLHDGRRELRQGAEERRTTRPSSRPADHRRRGALQLRRRRPAAAVSSSSSNSNSSSTATGPAGTGEQQQQEQREDVETRTRARRSTSSGRATRASSRSSAATRARSRTCGSSTRSQPAPTLETYRYAMPGEENIPQSEMFVFDVAEDARRRSRPTASRIRRCRSPPPKPQRPVARADPRRGGAAQRLRPMSDKLAISDKL